MNLYQGQGLLTELTTRLGMRYCFMPFIDGERIRLFYRCIDKVGSATVVKFRSFEFTTWTILEDLTSRKLL